MLIGAQECVSFPFLIGNLTNSIYAFLQPDNKKKNIRDEDLCSSMPLLFQEISMHIRKLCPPYKPDYNLYTRLLMQILQKYGIDAATFTLAYDWNKSHLKRPRFNLNQCNLIL